MSKTKHEFVKLELRLWQDPRFLSQTAFVRYCYIGLMALAKQTGNKIPRNCTLIKTFLRIECSDDDMQLTLDCIKQAFRKFRSSKYYYYFTAYRERYGNGPTKEPARDKSGRFSGAPLCLPPSDSPPLTPPEKEVEIEGYGTVIGTNTGDNFLVALYEQLHGVTRTQATVLKKIEAARSQGVNAGDIETAIHRAHSDGLKLDIWQILDPLKQKVAREKGAIGKQERADSRKKLVEWIEELNERGASRAAIEQAEERLKEHDAGR